MVFVADWRAAPSRYTACQLGEGRFGKARDQEDCRFAALVPVAVAAAAAAADAAVADEAVVAFGLSCPRYLES